MKKIPASDGRVLIRRSRWISIRHTYKPNRRNALWYYVRDGYGYAEGQKEFNPAEGLYLDWFRWNGRNWALEQFYRLGGIMGGAPIFFEDDGKTTYIAGYDSENYHDPILIELDEYGERVRVYEEA